MTDHGCVRADVEKFATARCHRQVAAATATQRKISHRAERLKGYGVAGTGLFLSTKAATNPTHKKLIIWIEM